MVEPEANVCGSTSVLCSLSPFLKVSLLSLTSVNCACSSAFRDMERAVRNTATLHADIHLSDETRIMETVPPDRSRCAASHREVSTRADSGTETREHYRSPDACQRDRKSTRLNSSHI